MCFRTDRPSVCSSARTVAGSRRDTKTPEHSVFALWPTPTGSACAAYQPPTASAHITDAPVHQTIRLRVITRLRSETVGPEERKTRGDHCEERGERGEQRADLGFLLFHHEACVE